jgi:branched-chain amino acid transport system permease protein
VTAFLTILISGIGLGAVYGLVAVSYNVVYRASNVFNLAQGQLLMLGSMAGYELTMAHKLPILVGLFAAAVLVGLVSFVIELIAIRPLNQDSASSLLWVLSTLGAGLLITAVAIRIWGDTPLAVSGYFSPVQWSIAGVQIPTVYVPVVGALLIIVWLLHLIERRTMFGKAIRALAVNRSAAVQAGVPVWRYTAFAFAIGGAVAGIAGYLTAPVLYFDPTSGFTVGILAFAGWAIGGFGSNVGAAIGGMIVGVAYQLFGFYVNQVFPPVGILAVLLLVTMVRPSGLLGKLSAREV